MRHLFKLLSIVVALPALVSISAPRANAQMAVIDPAAIVQAIEVVKNTLEQLEKMAEQIELAQKELAAMTGERAFIVGINGNIEILELPEGIDDFANQIAGYKEEFKIMDAAVVFEHDDFDRTQAIAAHDKTIAAVLSNMSSAETSIEKASKSIDRYEVYREELGNMQDLKESVDLQTRVQIENGMMLAQLLHTMAMQNNMDARQRAEDLQRQHEQERNLGVYKAPELDGDE